MTASPSAADLHSASAQLHNQPGLLITAGGGGGSSNTNLSLSARTLTPLFSTDRPFRRSLSCTHTHMTWLTGELDQR